MAGFPARIQKIEGAWRKFARITAIVGGGVLVLAAISVVADVSGRYLFLKPITGVSEGVGLLMPYIIFFAMAYALATDSHVRVTIFFDRLPLKTQLWADSITCILGMVFLGLLSYFSWVEFWKSIVVNEAMMSQVYLPAWLGKFAMPAGLFVFFIQYLLRLAVNWGRLTDKIQIIKEAPQKLMGE